MSHTRNRRKTLTGFKGIFFPVFNRYVENIGHSILDEFKEVNEVIEKPLGTKTRTVTSLVRMDIKRNLSNHTIQKFKEQ